MQHINERSYVVIAAATTTHTQIHVGMHSHFIFICTIAVDHSLSLPGSKWMIQISSSFSAFFDDERAEMKNSKISSIVKTKATTIDDYDDDGPWPRRRQELRFTWFLIMLSQVQF
jgi:hypothetical protein